MIIDPSASGPWADSVIGLGWKARAILAPRDTEEAASLLRLAWKHRAQMIPQAANSSLLGAALPDQSGAQFILSSLRLTGIQIQVEDRTARVGAGVRLSTLNRMAADHGLVFPIDVGADPMIGGMIGANTGGSKLIKYGGVRENVVGLRAVLADADATVLDLMSGARKDNTGLDLKQLFIGTSGSLGFVTEAIVALQRLPKAEAGALIGFRSAAAAVRLLGRCEARFGDLVSAFEGVSRPALLLGAELADRRRLVETLNAADYYSILELSSPVADLDLGTILADFLSAEQEGGADVYDAACFRTDDLWRIRDAIPPAVARAGSLLSFDIGLARTQIPAFRERAIAELTARHPSSTVCDFGHLADGGIHLTVLSPDDADERSPLGRRVAISRLVYELTVNDFGGSISAEHGVGPVNLPYYRWLVPETERRLSGSIQALCNPAKIIGRVMF